jgi:folate-binding protein YgfZ
VRVTTAPDIPPDYVAAREKIAHRFRAAGILDVTGMDRESFLQGQLTQDVRGLAPGEGRRAAGLTPKGKLLFVALVLALEDRLRLVAPESLRQLVLDHLRKYAVFTKAVIEDRSADFVRIGLYGPEAARLALPEGVDRLPARNEFSVDLLAPTSRRGELERLLDAVGSREVPEETAEILRVEAGRPRFGTDMDSTNLPDEVGMDDAISTTKGCYVGQEVVARLRTYGRVNRRLVSFRFSEGPIAAGDRLRLPDEETPSKVESGRVTSSVHSPRFGAIGLGYAFRDVALGARLVSDANPALSAIVEKLDTRIAD